MGSFKAIWWSLSEAMLPLTACSLVVWSGVNLQCKSSGKLSLYVHAALAREAWCFRGRQLEPRAMRFLLCFKAKHLALSVPLYSQLNKSEPAKLLVLVRDKIVDFICLHKTTGWRDEMRSSGNHLFWGRVSPEICCYFQANY